MFAGGQRVQQRRVGGMTDLSKHQHRRAHLAIDRNVQRRYRGKLAIVDRQRDDRVACFREGDRTRGDRRRTCAERSEEQ